MNRQTSCTVRRSRYNECIILQDWEGRNFYLKCILGFFSGHHLKIVPEARDLGHRDEYLRGGVPRRADGIS